MKKTKIFWLIIICFTGLFMGLTYLVISGKSSNIDSKVYEIINSLNSDGLTTFFKCYTQLGGPIGLISIALILFFIKTNMERYLIPLNLGLVFILNNIFKLLVARDRPIDINLIMESGYSFPSGHAMISIAFYGYIAYLLSKRFKDKKIFIYVITSLLVLLIGISRIYLGVHFATDVLAGWIIGFGYLLCFIKVSENK